MLQGLTVEVDGHPLLRDVDLAIPSGQHVALLGRSGAGKSTLVGTLLGWLGDVAGGIAALEPVAFACEEGLPAPRALERGRSRQLGRRRQPLAAGRYSSGQANSLQKKHRRRVISVVMLL